jgi:predicted dehydrogenase
MKTVRFGILGCGKIGTRHAAKLQQVDGAKLVAVCDIVPERAEALAKQYGARAYTTPEDFLNDAEIDFVNVCTPSGLHAEHAIAALEHGKHVLCEKPMALTVADAERMRDAAKKADRMLFVVKQNRHNPPVAFTKRLMKEGKLGEPLFGTVTVVWNRNDDYYASDAWRGQKALAGGAIYTQASHFVDLLLMFLGEPKAVYSVMDSKNPKIETDDVGVVAARFKNGALGSFNYTMHGTDKNHEGSLTLIFKDGTVKIGGEYLNTLEYFQVHDVPKPDLGEAAEANDYGTYKGSMSNHHKVFEDIVRVWNEPGAEHNLVDATEGIDTVRFIENAMRSAETGKVVYYD